MDDSTRDADGVYVEAGERTGETAGFTAERIGAAFGVARDRVAAAMRAEFGLAAGARIDSRMAQRLSEVLLVDQPLDRREAALMELGAYTPRRDADWGLGSGPPDEESDRQRASIDATAPAADSPTAETASETP